MYKAKIPPLVEALPHSDKFQLMQDLLPGQKMAAILQRMEDRNALSLVAEPLAWQKEIRDDRTLPGRD